MPINSFLYPGAKVTSVYEVANSCRFNSGSSDHLTRSLASTNTSWTFSAWVKRSQLNLTNYLISWGNSGTDGTGIGFTADDGYLFYYSESSPANKYKLTSAKHRDISAYYHIVCKSDSSAITLYVNGEEPTQSWSTGSSGNPLDTSTIAIGKWVTSNFYHNGYMAEVCFIDGTALNPTSFGEFDEDSPTIWKPKDVSGLTFGTNGFYLDFEDSGTLGNDANGGTDFTLVNLDSTHQSTDTCTNNFATLNPLNVPTSNAPVMSEGNLKTITMNVDPGYFGGTSTIGVSQGKWYAEIKITDNNGVGLVGITFNPSEVARNGATFSAGIEDSFLYANNAKQYSSAIGTSGSSYGNSFTDGDIIGIAMDLDNSKLYFSKNGTWQNSGDPTSGSTGTGAISITANKTYFFYLTDVGGVLATYECNFGSPPFAISSGNADANDYGNFEYSVPSGYYSLCTKNLAEFG